MNFAREIKMYKMTSYIVCHENINKVRNFLRKFFEEKADRYNHAEWITFRIPNTSFTLNLMNGQDQLLTQNYTMEIQCSSLKELEKLAFKHKKKIHKFKATKAQKDYMYNFITVNGPCGICKVDASFSEDL